MACRIAAPPPSEHGRYVIQIFGRRNVQQMEHKLELGQGLRCLDKRPKSIHKSNQNFSPKYGLLGNFVTSSK